LRFHPAGSDLKIWVEAIGDTTYLEATGSVTGVSAFGSTNGGTVTTLEGVNAAYDSSMGMYLVTIPANQLPANGNNFFAVVDWTGVIDTKIEAYITNPIASSAEIAALNNISSSQVLSQIQSALNSYDPPTKAELDSAISTVSGLINALNDVSINDILDAAIDTTHHTTQNSLARLLYILYCGSVGNIVNTASGRTIKDQSGNTLVTNTITSSESSVTRYGGHE
jgi:hypothetical protein